MLIHWTGFCHTSVWRVALLRLDLQTAARSFHNPANDIFLCFKRYCNRNDDLGLTATILSAQDDLILRNLRANPERTSLLSPREPPELILFGLWKNVLTAGLCIRHTKPDHDSSITALNLSYVFIYLRFTTIQHELRNPLRTFPRRCTIFAISNNSTLGRRLLDSHSFGWETHLVLGDKSSGGQRFLKSRRG